MNLKLFGKAMMVLTMAASTSYLPAGARPANSAPNPSNGGPELSTISNPVIDSNFPDPALLNDRGTYYAYCTNSGGHMPVRKSTDLQIWAPLPDAMPTLPAWAKPGRTWAPEVTMIKHDKRYVAYFAAWDRATDKQAIGVAVATRPEGPFIPVDEPLIEQAEIGGAIDPCCYVDTDGARYLIWKNDGNSMGHDTWLWIQRLSADNTQHEGSPTKLIKQDQHWEGPIVEAPCLWRHSDKYYLFYSAGFYADCSYSMGYAVSTSLLGPYVKPSTSPWVASTPGECGPGGQDVESGDDGTTWMAYHSWVKGPGTYRGMSIKRLEWDGDTPILR